MPNSSFSAGYLAEIEGSHLTAEALAGAVVVHLSREIASETAAGRKPRRMFIELTLGEALQHWRNMGDMIRMAGALERRPGHADAAGNL
jgi:hypothetical protein